MSAFRGKADIGNVIALTNVCLSAYGEKGAVKKEATVR